VERLLREGKDESPKRQRLVERSEAILLCPLEGRSKEQIQRKDGKEKERTFEGERLTGA